MLKDFFDIPIKALSINARTSSKETSYSHYSLRTDAFTVNTARATVLGYCGLTRVINSVFVLS